MLVLSRKQDQSIVFPNLGISIEIVRVQGNRVSVGVEAPKEVRIVRGELHSGTDDSRGLSNPVTTETMSELRYQLNNARQSVHAAHQQFHQSGCTASAAEFIGRAVEALDHLNKMLEFKATDSDNCVNESRTQYELATSRLPIFDVTTCLTQGPNFQPVIAS